MPNHRVQRIGGLRGFFEGFANASVGRSFELSLSRQHADPDRYPDARYLQQTWNNQEQKNLVISSIPAFGVELQIAAMYLQKVDWLKCCDIYDICNRLIIGFLARNHRF